jgi:tetratricopeptide (TPR) repeat protein
MNRILKLKELLNSSPTDCFLLHALGLEYVKIGEFEDAIASFNKVLETNKEYVGTYYHLAKTLERINKTSDAILIYEKGIDIASNLKDNHSRNELQMALEDLTM